MVLPEAEPVRSDPAGCAAGESGSPGSGEPPAAALNGHAVTLNSDEQVRLDAHRDALHRYAAHLLRDPARAQDVVQDTFARYWDHPPPPEVRQPENENRLKAWLFTVCRNRAFDVLRKEKRMTSLPAPVAAAQAHPGPGPADVAQQRDTHTHVLQRLAQLPGPQQEVVRLKFQSGLSYKQIAEVTGLTASHVGYLLHHALKTLRHELATPD